MGKPEPLTPGGEIDFAGLIQPDRIHGSLYTDPAIFELEMQRIFHDGWAFVGHASEIPSPGQYVTRQIGRQPVIMVRDRDDQVRVLVNRCQHRGNLLCNLAKGQVKNFTCPYHGWVFGLDGAVLDIPYAGGFRKTSANYALEQPRSASYRGFVFVNLGGQAVDFDAYLGVGRQLFDRACDLSPEGEIDLSAGWVRHRYSANWKMLPENDTDGYHVNFTHRSFVEAIDSHYSEFVHAEETIQGVTRDWGGGHTELDFAGGYQQPFSWLGTRAEKIPGYVAAMEKAYGKQVAAERFHAGPPHACIFPNLFLAEMNIVIFQPIGVGESVQWHTPMFLKGAPELNFRLLRQSEGALGPASFLVADDSSIAERTQLALQGGAPWCDLSRGEAREHRDQQGVLESHLTDETTNRGFWREYRRLMTTGGQAA